MRYQTRENEKSPLATAIRTAMVTQCDSQTWCFLGKIRRTAASNFSPMTSDQDKLREGENKRNKPEIRKSISKSLIIADNFYHNGSGNSHSFVITVCFWLGIAG